LERLGAYIKRKAEAATADLPEELARVPQHSLDTSGPHRMMSAPSVKIPKYQ
jgi:hypothetical protein